MNRDDRERARIRAFWRRVELWLRRYARCSAVRLLHLTNYEGVYLLLATVGLVAMASLAAWPEIPALCRYVLASLAIYYIADALLINTTITFISQQPIHRLRSVILTLLNVLNVGIAYAVLYAAERGAFAKPLTSIQSIYFSLVTLTTVGYGDIKPDGASAWLAQATVVLELASSLYLLAGVLSVVVSWTHQSERDSSDSNEPGAADERVHLARGITRLAIVLFVLWCSAVASVLAVKRASAATERATELRDLVELQDRRAPLTDWVFLYEHVHPTAGHAFDENGYPAPDLIASKTDPRQRRKYVNFGVYKGLEPLGGLQFPIETPDEDITRLLPERLPQQHPTKRDLETVQDEISGGNRAVTRAAYARASTESSVIWQALHIFSSGQAYVPDVALFLAPIAFVGLIAAVVFSVRWVLAGFVDGK